MRSYNVKKNKDKEIAIKLAIQTLRKVKNDIDGRIESLESFLNQIKIINLETHEGSDYIWTTRSVK